MRMIVLQSHYRCTAGCSYVSDSAYKSLGPDINRGKTKILTRPVRENVTSVEFIQIQETNIKT